MMKKIILLLCLLILAGVGFLRGMNYWQERVLTKNVDKIKNSEHLVLFLEKIY